MSVKKDQGMDLFEIAIEICGEGHEFLSEDFLVQILCDAWANNMKISVDGGEWGNTFINIDYMKWVKSRLEKRAGRAKPPCFISAQAQQWLTRIAEIARSYGGVGFWESGSIQAPFTYEGPYYPKYELRYRVRQAAEQAGLTYDDWKKFWRRNSMKIKEHMEPYFDDVTSDFPCWRW
jgi:hypothetical protein